MSPQTARRISIDDTSKAIGKRTLMASLEIPPVVDVRGIVLDMMPVVSPAADTMTIEWSILLAARLVALCRIAKEDATTERVFAEMFQGMLRQETCGAGKMGDR